MKNQTSKNEFLSLIEDVKDQKTFRFSSAWRPKGPASVVVPIIRTIPVPRRYMTIQEANHVEIQDTGSIDAVRILNNEKLPVFVRVGSLLGGKMTQSRAVNKSLIIPAGEEAEVSVNCVHSSHYIDPTAKFVAKSASLAPAMVERELLGGNQQAVWGAVSRYTAIKQTHGSRSIGLAGGGTDDLVGELDVKDKFTEAVDKLAKEVPNHEGQVGLAIFDERGVYGMEIFDSPDSWKVFNEAVLNKFADVLVQRVDEKVLDIRVNDQRVASAMNEFLVELGNLQGNQEQFGRCETVNVLGERICGEAVFMESNFVHLTAVRTGQEEAPASEA